MTIKKTYGSFVNILPINKLKKNWLMRNWVGGLVGLSAAIISVFSWSKLVVVDGPFFMAPTYLQNLSIPASLVYLMLNPLFDLIGSIMPSYNHHIFASIMLYLLLGMIGIFTGALIQSLIRRVIK